MSSAPALRCRLGVWLLAAVLPSLSTSNESTGGDDARILENTALNHVGCSVDISGNYISEIGVELKIVQTDCSLFVEPPGKVVGVVIGKQISIAGKQGHVVGGGKMIKEIMFSNNAAWTKQDDPKGKWPAPSTTLKPGTGSTSVVDPCSTVTKSAAASSTPPAEGVSTTFPWWAVGTGIAIAGASAIAGGVAVGLTHGETAHAPTQASKAVLPSGDLTKAPEVRFMSSATRSRVANEASGNQVAEIAVQPRVLASPIVLLGVLAVASFCCVLMLAGLIFTVQRMRSSKASRSLRAFRSDSGNSVLSEEAEDEAEEEDGRAEASLLAPVPEDA